MQIPKSGWVVKEVYFKAKLVDDFEQKYLEFMHSIGEIEDPLEDSDFNNAVYRWLQQDYVWLYEYPEEMCYGGYCDGVEYFEEEDDNWVIPRHLFEPIE